MISPSAGRFTILWQKIVENSNSGRKIGPTRLRLNVACPIAVDATQTRWPAEKLSPQFRNLARSQSPARAAVASNLIAGEFGKNFAIKMLAADQVLGAGQEIELVIGDLLLANAEDICNFFIAVTDDK